jgi:hypothetical protein
VLLFLQRLPAVYFGGAEADKQKTMPLKKQTTTWLLVIGFCTKREAERWQSVGMSGYLA